jgi:hypothetical protein
MPLYRTDPVKTSLFPTDRAERDPVTGMAVSIGFTPIRGKGVQVQSGMGEQFKPLTHDSRIRARDIEQGEQSTLDADTVDGKHAADFAAAYHTHPLTHITQSGATANQVPKWNAASSVWQPGFVHWSEVDGKPSAFPPEPHTHAASDIVSGRLTASRLPTSSTANRFLVVRTANSDPVYDAIQASDLPSHTHTRSQITDFAHAATHASGGTDALTGNLDANARVNVRKGGTSVGTRRSINLIEGTNVTINVTDDATNEKVDITINAAGGEPFVTATAPPQSIGSGSYFVLARITVPTQKPNLKVIAVAISPFYGYGVPGNAQIVLYNETDGVTVASWGSAAGPVYFEPNTSYNLSGKTVSFRLTHGASGTQECWGSVSFKLTS